MTRSPKSHKIRSLKDVADLQKWMMKAITTPPGAHPKKLAREAAHYLTASPAGVAHPLTARERLEIYVGDFWPRCLESLKEDFPGAMALLGEAVFTKWLEKYLTAYPATSFTMRDLGKNLEKFMKRAYRGPRQAALLDIIRTEWSHMESASAGQAPPYDPMHLTDTQKKRLASIRLGLQPHIQLFEIRHDVPRWLSTKKGRILKAKTPVITYRSPRGVFSQSIPAPFYYLLKGFEKKGTLSRAVDRMIQKSPGAVTESQMTLWMEECIRKGWLTVDG